MEFKMFRKHEELIGRAYQASTEYLAMQALRHAGKPVSKEREDTNYQLIEEVRKQFQAVGEDKGPFTFELDAAFFLEGDTFEVEIDERKENIAWLLVKTVVGDWRVELLNATKDLAKLGGAKVTTISGKSVEKVLDAVLNKFRKPAETDTPGTHVDAEDATDVSAFLKRFRKLTGANLRWHTSDRRKFELLLAWLRKRNPEAHARIEREFFATGNPRKPRQQRPAKANAPAAPKAPVAPPTLEEQLADAQKAKASALQAEDGDALNLAKAEIARITDLIAKRDAATNAKPSEPTNADLVTNLKAQIASLYNEADTLRNAGDRKAAIAKELEAEPIEDQIVVLTKALHAANPATATIPLTAAEDEDEGGGDEAGEEVLPADPAPPQPSTPTTPQTSSKPATEAEWTDFVAVMGLETVHALYERVVAIANKAEGNPPLYQGLKPYGIAVAIRDARERNKLDSTRGYDEPTAVARALSATIIAS